VLLTPARRLRRVRIKAVRESVCHVEECF